MIYIIIRDCGEYSDRRVSVLPVFWTDKAAVESEVERLNIEAARQSKAYWESTESYGRSERKLTEWDPATQTVAEYDTAYRTRLTQIYLALGDQEPTAEQVKSVCECPDQDCEYHLEALTEAEALVAALPPGTEGDENGGVSDLRVMWTPSKARGDSGWSRVRALQRYISERKTFDDGERLIVFRFIDPEEPPPDSLYHYGWMLAEISELWRCRPDGTLWAGLQCALPATYGCPIPTRDEFEAAWAAPAA